MLNIHMVFVLLSSVIDILAVAVIIYFALKLIVKSEKHITIVVGIVVCLMAYGLAKILQLHTLSVLMDNVFSWSIVIIVILFQEEIKSYLETIGTINSIFKKNKSAESSYIDEIADAAYQMGKVKTGALITVKIASILDKYTNNAVKVDAQLSQFLLLSIFNKESPLHDGAVIIENERVMYASTYFPISLDINISKEYGTRHRAALTISRETDTISIIVSEETGKVSIAYNGEIYADVEKEFLIQFLNEKTNQE